MKAKKSSVSNSDALFIGWQETLEGNLIALYMINDKNHPSYRSTVTEKTLKELNLKVPETIIPLSNHKENPQETAN